MTKNLEAIRSYLQLSSPLTLEADFMLFRPAFESPSEELRFGEIVFGNYTKSLASKIKSLVDADPSSFPQVS